MVLNRFWLKYKFFFLNGAEVFKDTLKVFDDFKYKQKCVWNVFWHVKLFIFWKFIQCTIHWDKTQLLKKFSSDKIYGAKTRTRLSFTFNSLFLYELKRKDGFCKSVFGIYHFKFCFVFIKVYIFAQQKVLILWR